MVAGRHGLFEDFQFRLSVPKQSQTSEQNRREIHERAMMWPCSANRHVHNLDAVQIVLLRCSACNHRVCVVHQGHFCFSKYRAVPYHTVPCRTVQCLYKSVRGSERAGMVQECPAVPGWPWSHRRGDPQRRRLKRDPEKEAGSFPLRRAGG